jgi:hypothetical protein
MTLSDKQWEFLKDVCLLIQFAERKGWKLTGGELWRPQEMQDIYVERGLSQTREGQHLKRLAIDLNLFVDGKFMQKTEDHKELGEFWESIRPENRWGGRFNDGNHYERRG